MYIVRLVRFFFLPRTTQPIELREDYNWSEDSSWREKKLLLYLTTRSPENLNYQRCKCLVIDIPQHNFVAVKPLVHNIQVRYIEKNKHRNFTIDYQESFFASFSSLLFTY